MGLVSFLLTLPVSGPLAPVRGVIWFGELIQDQVDQELHDPASVRRELEEAAEARAAGEITAEEEAAVERDALDRVTRPAGGEPTRR